MSCVTNALGRVCNVWLFIERRGKDVEGEDRFAFFSLVRFTVFEENIVVGFERPFVWSRFWVLVCLCCCKNLFFIIFRVILCLPSHRHLLWSSVSSGSRPLLRPVHPLFFIFISGYSVVYQDGLLTALRRFWVLFSAVGATRGVRASMVR